MGPRAARHRAASLTRAAMLYRRSLKRGEVPPEGTKEAPSCMDTYRYVPQPRLLALVYMVHGQVDVRLCACPRYRGPRLERVAC